jgi:hypothetical protein
VPKPVEKFMNELLTELYRSSRPKESLASQDEFKSANALLGSEVEKFAELIIKECASAVNSRDDSDTGFWANVIKEHFGVEE